MTNIRFLVGLLLLVVPNFVSAQTPTDQSSSANNTFTSEIKSSVGSAVSASSSSASSSIPTECDRALSNLAELAAKSATDVTAFTAIVQLCPRSAEAHYALGVAQRKAGKLVDSRAEFSRALELRDITPYRVASGVAAFEAGNIDEAAQLFGRALELEPRSIAAMQGKALVAAHQGDVPLALELLERAIAIDSSNASLLFNRAVLRERTQHLAEAATDYQRVTTLDPSNTVAWCRTGYIRYALKLVDAALPSLTQCCDRGDPIEGCLFFSQALADTGELDRAELTLRRVITKNPADVSLKIALAEVYLRMKRFDRALATAKTATVIGANDARAWSVLGRASLGLGNAAEGEAAMSKARTLGGGNDPGLLNNLGVAQMRLGHTTEANALFEEALKIDRQFEPAKNNFESNQ